MGDRVRHAAEHPPLHPLVADHEHVGAAALGQFDEHLGWVALLDHGAAVDAAGAERRLRALELLGQPRGRARGPLDLERGPAQVGRVPVPCVAEGTDQNELRLVAAGHVGRRFDGLAGGVGAIVPTATVEIMRREYLRAGAACPPSVAQLAWATDALALPPPPPAHLRFGGRPGAHRQDASQRHRARPGPPCVPVRRLARHRQDVDGEAPGVRAERRGRPQRRFRPGQLGGARDPRRDLARRGRDGRRVEQLGRRHPRAARERRARADAGRQPRVHPRRGAHALDGGLERVPEDARGAAAARGLRARDDRGAQGAGHDRRSLPPLRLPAPLARADRGRACGAWPPRRRSRSPMPPSACSLAPRPARSATRSARSSSS